MGGKVEGWRAMLGSTPEALALFRISLGFLLTCELVLRFQYLHVFYTDEGTMPLNLLLPRIDDLYKAVCLHCHFGDLWQQQVLLTIQVFVSILLTLGYKTRVMSVISWYMYTSLILRCTWLYFILDRYFYYLLFLSMFLPLDERWSISRPLNKSEPSRLVLNPATIGLKALILWIYIDAGGGKLMDPNKGWTYHADPLPALDTYTRHTVFARYLYGILGPEGLRLMTPTVVWVELLSCPLALVGSYLGITFLVKLAISLILSLHIGISFSIRNSYLLSYVACSAWCVFLPIGWETMQSSKVRKRSVLTLLGLLVSSCMIGGMAASNVWFETIGKDCSTSSLRQIWSTLLQNRWNVFIGAEEYVTWEIAPGLLADGSVVDVWGRKDHVDWTMPGSGAPCTSTSRPGRWRSFPYIADLQGEDAEALWGYLCKQWDWENNAEEKPGRKLVKFNFFMLQADVLPNMGFSATRKRLVYTHECANSNQTNGNGDEIVDDVTENASSTSDEL
ncbi:unnamed protein product [Cylindrotheca closterium]|uniref:HTTM-like domain-containing protein n=1 Tax=Cylindrotheca closterium TaxID=2856 RepID=A0AAD2CYS4_9STRA|nr:unnamed protein product [Cylindrotheca closterium]